MRERTTHAGHCCGLAGLTQFLRAAITLLIAAGTIVLASPNAARADAWVNRDVPATRVYHYSVWLTAGIYYRFRTTSLVSADPVMHLWRDMTNTEVGYDDDCLPGVLGCDTSSSSNSLVSYHATATGWFTVFVRAYGSYGGTGQVQWCWDSVPNCNVWSNLGDLGYFGGYKVTVAFPTSGSYRYQTSEVQGGTSDTILLGLDNNQSGHMVAYDDDHGVDWMSAIGTWSGDPGSVRKLCISVYSTDGLTNVYTNDYLYGDTPPTGDGDGLGAYLEYYLGTCNTSAWPDPYTLGHIYCCSGSAAGCPNSIDASNVPQRVKDTDADGLSDYAEVFGIDTSPPQKLPAWGASPTHKDMFFEVDQKCVAGPPPTYCASPIVGQTPMISEIELGKMQAPYAAGPKNDLLNRDGADGISLHFDIGTAGDSCSNHSLCFNGGGGGSIWTDMVMSPVRKQVFRRFFLSTDPGTCHGVGDGVTCYVDGIQMAHEMGHTLWLQHYGIPDWKGYGPPGGSPPWEMNSKPHYRSIMGYPFEYKPGTTFSKGENSGVIHDPARTRELNALAVSAWYLTTGSGLSNMNFPSVAGSGPNDVDFNRDGLIDTHWIRAGIAMCGVENGQCFASYVGFGKVTTSTPEVPLASTTPDVAGFNLPGLDGRIFVWWIAPDAVGTTDVIYYRSDIRTGPNHKGSCSGGNGLITETNCNQWSSPAWNYRGPDDGSVRVTGVAAMEWDDGIKKMYVAYRSEDAAGTVRVASTPTYDVLGQLGSPTPWSVATVPGTTDSLSQVELTPMYVNPLNPDFAGASKVLAVFVLSGGVHKWSWLSAAGTWMPLRNVVENVSGSPVSGTAVAGVAVWPNRRASWPDYSIASNCTDCAACGLFTFPAAPPSEPNARAHFMCYEKSSDRWNDLTASAFLDGKGLINLGRARPGIAYHTLRRAPDDEQAGGGVEVFALDDDPRIGQFWMTTPYGAPRPQLFVSSRVDNTHAPGASTKIRAVDFMFNGTSLNSGGSLYEDGELSSLKGATIQMSLTNESTPRSYPELFFLPFVDGTYRAPGLNDGNDYQVIESAVCKSLWPAAAQSYACSSDTCVCGGPNPFGH